MFQMMRTGARLKDWITGIQPVSVSSVVHEESLLYDLPDL